MAIPASRRICHDADGAGSVGGGTTVVSTGSTGATGTSESGATWAAAGMTTGRGRERRFRAARFFAAMAAFNSARNILTVFLAALASFFSCLNFFFARLSSAFASCAAFFKASASFCAAARRVANFEGREVAALMAGGECINGADHARRWQSQDR